MARPNLDCPIPLPVLSLVLILYSSLAYGDRLCALPGFNECGYEGETACCDVLQTMTSCPTGYYLCGGEAAINAGVLMDGVTEDGYGGACCPSFYTCLPNPSCVSTITATSPVDTVTLTATSTTLQTSFIVKNITSFRTETVMTTLMATTEYDLKVPPHTKATTVTLAETLVDGTVGATHIQTSPWSTGMVVYQTYAVKLNIGYPGMLDPAEHDSSPWSTFSTRKKAGTIIGATIGVITLIVALYVAVRALLRRRRTSAGRGARGGAMGPYTHGQGNEGSRRWHGGGRGHGLWGITGRKLGTCSSSREKVAEVSGSKRTAELQDTTVVEMPANEVVR